MKRAFLTLSLVIAVAAGAAAQNSKEKKKKENKQSAVPAQTIDSGSFGIYVQGQRVATEKFSIQQGPSGSRTAAELIAENGAGEQRADMDLTPAGDIRRYHWRASKPLNVETIVEPSDAFVAQRFSTPGEPDKVKSTMHLLPPSTIILDDNFFTHRQLLAWRYLAAGCGGKSPNAGCKLNKTEFGVLIPNQHTSAVVILEYVGREKIAVNGVERELSRIKLVSDDQEWALWLDDDHRVVRIVVPSANTEVIRD